MKQREIKFRAWDKEDKCMVHSSSDFMTMNGKNQFGRDWIYLQFTGLLDKNGKEIYEGDIVQSKHYLPDSKGGYVFPSDESNTEVRKEIVSWNDKAARFDNTLGEVIGNIYENPELLEKIKKGGQI